MACGAGLLLFLSPAFAGNPLEVRARFVDGKPAPDKATVVAQPLGKTSVSDARTFAIEPPGHIQLDLPAGSVWDVSVRAPGYWGEPVILTAGAPNQQPVELRAWPTTTISGKVEVERGEAIPQELRVRFEPTPAQNQKEPVLPRASLACPVAEARWTCEIPAGNLDLRLRAKGFVSHFRWDVPLKPGQIKDLGVFHLQRGASLAGWVEVAEGALAPETCLVELQPAIASPQAAAGEPERLKRLALTTKVNDRGFFHFEGIPAGSYTVTARQAGFAPATLYPIGVLANAETELREPLVLQPAAALEVQVTPAFDVFDRPFTIALMHQSDVPGALKEVARGKTSLEGMFTREGLTPGNYLVQVLDGDGSRLHMTPVVVDRVSTHLAIELSLVWVEGTVELGDEPLSADLWFGGRFGAESVQLAANEEGEFVGSLPREGEWEVYVESEDPPVRRTFKKVEVRPKKGARAATVELHLPDTEMSGVVIDEEGRPTSGAQVHLLDPTSGKRSSLRTNGEGEFRFVGLSEGPMTVHAELQTKSSDRLTVWVVEDQTSPPARLVLREMVTLRGRVVAATGGVPGAHVHAFPYSATQQTLLAITEVGTDASGNFELSVSAAAGTIDLIVFPPGFALTTLQLQAIPKEPLLIEVAAPGGTLVWNLDPPIDWSDPLSAKPVLARDGFVVDPFVLKQWALVNGEPNRDPAKLVVPSLPPGPLSVCLLRKRPEDLLTRFVPDPASCRSGHLAPLSTLTLGPL